MRYDCTWIDQEAFLDQVNRGGADPVARPLESVSYVEEKGGGLVIVSIDGQPRDCMPTLANSFHPCRGQRGLAESRWSRDDGELLPRKLRGHVEEPWTLDQPLASWGDDLGGEEIELLLAGRRGRLACRAHCRRLCQGKVPF